jgi:hypothetical protein
MGKSRLKILWIGIIIFVLMGLFPPKESHTPAGSYADGYGFIFTVDNIDFNRLFVQWAIVAVVTGGLIYSLKVDPELMLKIRCRLLSWLSDNANTNQKTVQQNNKPKTD